MKISIDAVSVPTGVTFGMAFAAGEVPADIGFLLKLPFVSPPIPVQVDQRATDKTGLRFAVLSAVLPIGLAGNIDLLPTLPGVPTPSNAVLPQSLGISISLKMADGTVWLGNLANATLMRKWLDGPIACEWEYLMEFFNQATHPHLSARVNVRSYAGIAGERVDICIENCDAWAAAPSNYTYEATILIRGVAKLIPQLIHYRQTRWRYIASTLPETIVRLDNAYLRKTGAVPNYDSVAIDEGTMIAWQSAANSAKPMGNILLRSTMSATGGRPEIGILPAWGAAYCISMNARTRAVTLAVGNLAGSWPIHYRDNTTDRPVSIVSYPDITLLGNAGDTKHPLPTCVAPGDCSISPLKPDWAHQPSLAYIPYIITGDHYYLEELQFWANYNIIAANPAYREFGKGVLKWGELRGQAWMIRTVAHAAFITPDSDAFKAYFAMSLNNTLDFFATNITNSLGLATTGAFAYSNGTGFAPWQDDFFTQSIGAVAAMGFDKAIPVLKYKAQSPVGRMLDMCWIGAASYAMVGKAAAAGPIFSTWKEVEQATFASTFTGSPAIKYLDLACNSQAMADFLTAQQGSKFVIGQMTGYADGGEGYPSNMQPALAAAVDSGIPRAKEAWDLFMSRSVKPTDYGKGPQFAIVPRSVVAPIPVPVPIPVPTPTPIPPTPSNQLWVNIPGGFVKITATFETVQIPVPTPTPAPVPTPIPVPIPVPVPVPVDPTLSAFEKILLNLHADSWYEAPGSAPSLVGLPGAAAIILAWGGGAYDPIHRKMLLWGGGHTDYSGNEVYAFDLKTGTWARLTSPSSGPYSIDPLADGNPVSRHTYGGLQYLKATNRFFAVGGSRAIDGGPCYATWLFDIDTKKWTNAMTLTDTAQAMAGMQNTSGYDEASNTVLVRSHNMLMAYDATANVWTLLTGFGMAPRWPRYDVSGNKGGAIDTKRRLFWSVGSNDILVWDIANKAIVTDTWKTTGGAAYTNSPRVNATSYPDQAFASGGGDILNANGPGWDYDTKADCFLGWAGGAPWKLNCATKVWTQKSSVGAPQLQAINGTYGRWRYIPHVNVFCLVNSWTGSVLFYKHTAGGPV